MQRPHCKNSTNSFKCKSLFSYAFSIGAEPLRLINFRYLFQLLSNGLLASVHFGTLVKMLMIWPWDFKILTKEPHAAQLTFSKFENPRMSFIWTNVNFQSKTQLQFCFYNFNWRLYYFAHYSPSPICDKMYTFLPVVCFVQSRPVSHLPDKTDQAIFFVNCQKARYTNSIFS